MVWNKPHQQSFKESMRNKCKTQENSPWKQENEEFAEIFCKTKTWGRWTVGGEEESGKGGEIFRSFPSPLFLLAIYKEKKRSQR